MSSKKSPPTFGNLGKSFKDLFKKKYDFDNIIKVVNKTNFGLTLTTSGKFLKDSISGNTKGVYKDHFGEAEAEIDTGSGKVFAKTTLTNVVPSGKLIVSGGFDPTSKDPLVKTNWSVKTEAEYFYDIFAASGSILVGEDAKGAVGSAIEVADVISGIDGLSVGGQVKFGLDQASQSIEDYNLGVQYEQKGFTATLLTEYKAEVVRFSWFHKVNNNYSVGAEVISDELDHLAPPSNPRRKVLTLASEFQLDNDTQIKAKANNYGEVSTVIEHRLSNPSFLLTAAAQFKAVGSSKLTTDKFGIGLSFGEN